MSGERAQPPRSTPRQEAILAVIEAARRPLLPREILALARKRAPTLGQATVYRAIARLSESGAIAAVALPGQPPRYESRRAAGRHHHHFHCDACGRVFDVHGCPGGLERLAPPGFEVKRHDVVLYGDCEECSTKRE